MIRWDFVVSAVDAGVSWTEAGVQLNTARMGLIRVMVHHEWWPDGVEGVYPMPGHSLRVEWRGPAEGFSEAEDCGSERFFVTQELLERAHLPVLVRECEIGHGYTVGFHIDDPDEELGDNLKDVAVFRVSIRDQFGKLRLIRRSLACEFERVSPISAPEPGSDLPRTVEGMSSLIKDLLSKPGDDAK